MLANTRINEITPAYSANLINDLIADKRSGNTKRAYQKDLENFFLNTFHKEPNTAVIYQFLNLNRLQANTIVLGYKSSLIQRGLSEATVNRRLAAIKSLVAYAHKTGRCEWLLTDIQGEKVEPYRDTSGITVDQMSKILSIPDRSTVKGKRDYAILRLLWENALRRSEISKTNISDYNPEELTLSILGKGKGSQKETISLSQKTAQAINEWLQTRGEVDPGEPLFIAVDNCNRGHQITGEAILYLVNQVCKKAGINKKMSPHRLRHSSITAALEATNGNVTMVQKLSRHSKIETLMIYEDKRTNQQKQVTETLSNLV